jgi:hypothetical protein
MAPSHMELGLHRSINLDRIFVFCICFVTASTAMLSSCSEELEVASKRLHKGFSRCETITGVDDHPARYNLLESKL